ncbi:hypothetical protein J7T55_005597 [Diaporthe amygdali]|uniref:uncharacterized protein n=1 Tax=Phomopsis amygdali TaxID=1214568 RepID=UPI0022FE01BD|nr:uncharacterized protein J7T55_005597 [Diaporthe amygdali]KAJ0124259.1 hypothetical protein J7T55_005597 [Diaporthe amygdali]
MAKAMFYVFIGFIAARMPLPTQGIILGILLGIILYDLRDPSIEFDEDQEPPIAASECFEALEEVNVTPAPPRPPLRRRLCFVLGPKGMTLEPIPAASASDSSSAPQSEELVTVGDVEAPAPSIEEETALQYFEQRACEQKNSVSFPEYSILASKAGLIPTKLKDRFEVETDDEEGTVKLMLRNIKMRGEGVRVEVSYSQLSDLKNTTPATSQTPAPRPEPSATTDVHGVRSAVNSSPYVPATPSCSSSCASTTPSFSGVQSSTPRPTPCGDITGITTPDKQSNQIAPSRPSVLPTSGRAGSFLEEIDEKLLAVPADAVSRRLLRDGRAILHRNRRLPRNGSLVGGISTHQAGSAESGQVSRRARTGYPSELME